MFSQVLTSFDSFPGPSSVLVGKLKKRDFLRVAAGGCHLVETRVFTNQNLTQYFGHAVLKSKVICIYYPNVCSRFFLNKKKLYTHVQHTFIEDIYVGIKTLKPLKFRLKEKF